MLLAAVAAIVTSSGSAFAGCSPADFKVLGFRSGAANSCSADVPCPVFKFTGEIENDCSDSAGAQLKVTGFDKDGSVVSTVNEWPASVRNIAPGDRYAFDLGPMMNYDPSISSVQIQVIDVRTW